MIPTSLIGSTQTTPIEQAHDKKTMLDWSFFAQKLILSSVLMCSCTLLGALMLCTRWGFTKLVKWTIQLHVNFRYFNQWGFTRWGFTKLFSMISNFYNLVAFIFIPGAISKATSVLHAMQLLLHEHCNKHNIAKTGLQLTTETSNINNSILSMLSNI